MRSVESKRARRAIVVGSGVSGLSCGVLLLEAGFAVEIRAREPAQRTTSRLAAAIWYPFKAGPAERVAQWSLASLRTFTAIARDPTSGVRLRSGVELFPTPVAAHGWLAAIEHRAARADELSRGSTHGFAYAVPVVEMPVYLGWLERRFRALGGTILEIEIAALDDVLAECPIVVDASGLGARELALDPLVHPIRGQLVRVERVGIERFVLDDHGPGGITYVVPRSEDCVLGGTAEEGVSDLAPDPATSAAILARCRALEPRLERARVLEEVVGLRPGRATVRLEAETREKGLVVHDYGHGGAGVTLSWGCAEEVRDLVVG
jgi:D-amino-acid oxidase